MKDKIFTRSDFLRVADVTATAAALRSDILGKAGAEPTTCGSNV